MNDMFEKKNHHFSWEIQLHSWFVQWSFFHCHSWRTGFFRTDAVTGLQRILREQLLGAPPSGAILTKIMCVRSLRSIQKMLKRDLEAPFCGFSLVVGTAESNETLYYHLDEELPTFAQGTTNMLTNLWTLSDHLRMPWIVISWMWSLVAWASHHPRRCGVFRVWNAQVVQWLGLCGRCWKGF